MKEEFWNFHSSHIKHGDFTKWFDNGQIEWQGKFISGLREGEIVEYYKNGTLHSIQNYEKGLQQGESKYFKPNGELSYKAFYINL